MVARVTLPFQSPMCSSTARARPCTGFSLEWTGLRQTLSLLGFNPSVFASSTEIKLWVGPLFTMARVFFQLIPTLTWMSPLITDLGFYLFGHGIDQLSRSPNVTPHLAPPHLAFM